MCGDLELATVASPSSGSFADTTKVKPDDYYNDWEVYCYDGNAASVADTGTITNFANDGSVFTFEPVATWVAADNVELHRHFTVVEYNDLINMVIDGLARHCLKDKVDASIDLGAAVYEYSVPAGFLYISKIHLETSTGNLFEGTPIDQLYYYFMQGATPKLVFVKEYWTPTAGRALRLIGQERRQASLSADASTVDEDLTKYICYETAGLLLQSEEETRAKGIAYQAIALSEKEGIRTALHAGARKVRDI